VSDRSPIAIAIESAKCTSCEDEIAPGAFRFAVEGGLLHLRCAANENPSALAAALRAFRVEIPGLDSAIANTAAIELLPEMSHLRAQRAIDKGAALELWASEVVLPRSAGEIGGFLATLRRPIAVPRHWPARYGAVTAAIASSDLALTFAALRALNMYRDQRIGLSFGEQKAFDSLMSRAAEWLASSSGCSVADAKTTVLSALGARHE
jgi:hypothetical protein